MNTKIVAFTASATLMIFSELAGGTMNRMPRKALSSVATIPGHRPPHQAAAMTAITNGISRACSARVSLNATRTNSTTVHATIATA